MEDTQGLAPFTLIDQVIPFRNDIVYRATVMTVRNTAIHATGTLLPDLWIAQRDREFIIVLQAFLFGPVRPFAPGDLYEACWFTHTAYSPATATLSLDQDTACVLSCISCKARR